LQCSVLKSEEQLTNAKTAQASAKRASKTLEKVLSFDQFREAKENMETNIRGEYEVSNAIAMGIGSYY